MFTIAENCRIKMVTKYDRKTRIYPNVACVTGYEAPNIYMISYYAENGELYTDIYNIRDIARMSMGSRYEDDGGMTETTEEDNDHVVEE